MDPCTRPDTSCCVLSFLSTPLSSDSRYMSACTCLFPFAARAAQVQASTVVAVIFFSVCACIRSPLCTLLEDGDGNTRERITPSLRCVERQPSVNRWLRRESSLVVCTTFLQIHGQVGDCINVGNKWRSSDAQEYVPGNTVIA